MPGFILRRDHESDRDRLPYDIAGVIVNGDDEADAVDNAVGILSDLVNPAEAELARNWTVSPTGGRNHIFTVDIHDDATPGTITLSVNGVSTGAIAINADAATIKTAIDGTLGAGYCTVSIGVGSGLSELDYLWTVEFHAEAGEQFVVVTMNTGGLTGSDTATLDADSQPGALPTDFPDELDGAVIQGDVVTSGQRLRGAGPAVP